LEDVEFEHVMLEVVGAATVELQSGASWAPAVEAAVGFVGMAAADFVRGAGVA
jgi:hypothetical protein